MTAFRFNHAELNRIAREELGIEWPIRLIRRTRRYDARTGLYSVRRDTHGWTVWQADRTHEVMLVNRPLGLMLRTLAHELRHCWQSEQFISPRRWSDTYAAERSRELAYLRAAGLPRPAYIGAFEEDARDAEDRWEELLPCVTFPRTRGAA